MLVTIRDTYEVQTLVRLKDGIIDEPAHLYASWLAKNDWTVAPAMSASHFGAEDGAWMASALAYAKCSGIFGIATEPLEKTPTCYTLTVSEEDLMAFNWECAHFNFALIPADRSLAILCTVYDYFLVAGPREFVRLAMHGDIEAAWHEFEEEAEDPCWEGRLQKIANRYRAFSGLRD